MTALFNLFYLYDPWLFHVVRMSFVAGLAALVVLAYQYFKKQKPQGITVPVDSLAVIIGLITFSVIPLLVNGTVIGLLGASFMIDFLLSTNAVLPARFYGSEQEYRLYNITATAFFQLSLFYLMLLHFLLAYNAKHNTLPSILVFFMLSGRTFLLLSVVSILVYFKWRYVPSLIAFAVLVLLLAYFLPENPYVAHALEPVINLLHGAGFVSSSTDTLMKNHLFMPTLKQFIYGDGMYMTGELEVGRYYGHTDSGFLRQILYGGVSYALVCFAVTFYFVRKVALNWFDGSWKFILSAFVILAFCNIKADTFAFPGIMFVMLMFLSLFGTHGKQLILFKQQEQKDV